MRYPARRAKSMDYFRSRFAPQEVFLQTAQSKTTSQITLERFQILSGERGSVVRVFLVDDSAAARSALKAALQRRSEWVVVGEAYKRPS
jgi:hypothetical protein